MLPIAMSLVRKSCRTKAQLRLVRKRNALALNVVYVLIFWRLFHLELCTGQFLSNVDGSLRV